MQCGYCLVRHPDLGRSSPAPRPDPSEAQGARRARSQPVPVRGPQPHRARGAARGRARRTHDHDRATAADQPRTPTRGCRAGCASMPAASSRLSPGKIEIGQGIVTALAQIAADELDIDIAPHPHDARHHGGKPQRGRHVGQPLGASSRARPCATPPREARAIYLGCRGAAARRRRREPARSRTAPSSARATCAPAIGSWPTTALLARDATPGVAAKAAGGAGASPARAVARLDLPDKVFGRAALRARPQLARPAARPRAEAGRAGRRS